MLGALNLLTSASLGLPADFFESYYSPHMPETVSLRLAYYPPLSHEAQSSSAMCYSKHTDHTGFTILHQDEDDADDDVSAGHGLQVLLPNGEWHPSPRRPVLSNEHWRPVRGVDEWAVAIDCPSSDEAPARLRHRLVTTPVDPVLHRSAQ